VRFLLLDHYFGQDIAELRDAAGDDVEFEIMSYELLRHEALRVLPADVATGLVAFARPELEPARRRYGAILREILEDRFARAPFDALVLPSDTFFYVRAAADVAHALGVPLLVAQKETTISEHTMRAHAEELRRYAPPQADRITVCSERHRQFWIRAGADPASVTVTGQPRFDFYARTSRWPTDVPYGRGGPSVLFLSYAVDAYHPGEGHGESAWDGLHRETEEGLYELARRGWRVLIKPHPQQSREAIGDWRERAGDLWNRRVFLVRPESDVRGLIVGADVTVGFQTTGLLEAMLAGRPTVYTGWDDQAQALGGDLIPFHEWGAVIDVVSRPQDLLAVVEAARGDTCTPQALQRRREIAEYYLGPLDGGSSARTLAVLRGEAEAWAAGRGPEAMQLRAQLAGRRPPLRLARRSRSGVRVAKRRIGAMLGR
jgi:hypothetical protein